MKYAVNCVLMGGMYVKWDDLDDELHIFNIRHIHTQKFKKKWANVETWIANKQCPLAAS